MPSHATTMVRNTPRVIHDVDATGQTLGRLASRIAILLRGKHKPTFTPNVDGGDFVRVSHLDQARFTGTKLTGKLYHKYSGYPGGLRTQTLRTAWAKDAERLFRDIVYGMLPVNRTRIRTIKRLTFTK